MTTAARPKRKRGVPPEPPALPAINLSQIQEYNRCRYRWNLRYNRGIDRRQMHGPMDTGSAVHAGVAAAIRTHGAVKKVTKAHQRRVGAAADEAVLATMETFYEKMGGWDNMTVEEQDKAQQVFETAIAVTRRTIVYLDLPRWRTIWLADEPLIEKKLTCIEQGFLFYGTPDWVAEDLEEGGVFVLDYKVRKTFTPEIAEEINVQFPAYQYLLLANGVRTVGSVMFQTKAQAPSVPKLNKNGSMSRAKIATDWETYSAELIKNELDPEEYIVDMKPKLDTEFYRSTPVHRNDLIVGRIWENLVVPVAREMVAGPKSVHRSMHFMNCNGCWARDFCTAELFDEDTGFLLDTQYYDVTKPTPRVVMRPEDFDFTED